MNERLDITLTIQPNCTLEAVDNTNYTLASDLLQHVFLEYIVYEPYAEVNLSPIVDSINTINIETSEDIPLLKEKYTVSLSNDGTYTYYKFGISKLEHLLNQGIYKIKNKVFYYNNKYYYGISDINSPDNINSDTTIEFTNLYDLKDYMVTGIDFFYDERIFTICKLNKCLVAIQKKILFDNFKNKCTYDKCSTDEDLRLRRNFLLDAVYLLGYLIDSKNYLEAQRILEMLSSCNLICEDILISNNKCNCERTI